MADTYTSDSDLIHAYNYDEFIDTKFERWMRFDQSPPLNQRAPDFAVTDLDGQTLRLSDIWRTHRYTIIEFGSLT